MVLLLMVLLLMVLLHSFSKNAERLERVFIIAAPVVAYL
jgi:hypothetical protein